MGNDKDPTTVHLAGDGFIEIRFGGKGDGPQHKILEECGIEEREELLQLLRDNGVEDLDEVLEVHLDAEGKYLGYVHKDR